MTGPPIMRQQMVNQSNLLTFSWSIRPSNAREMENKISRKSGKPSAIRNDVTPSLEALRMTKDCETTADTTLLTNSLQHRVFKRRFVGSDPAHALSFDSN